MSQPQEEKKQKAPTHIRDARGKKVTQLDPVEMRFFRQHAAIDAEALRPIADEISEKVKEKGPPRLGFFFIAMGVIVGIVFIVQLIDYAVHGNILGFFNARNVVFANLWFWAVVVWSLARQKRFGKIKEIMLTHRRCPHCGYDIRGLPVDPEDSATLCPECGCAWKLED